MPLTCTVPLCEKCRNYDWEAMREIKAVYASCGWPMPSHIWCKATDRPEDMRYRRCENFGAMRYA